ncbi:unnamed protein product, partial [Symbiodinium sp. CCMP2592]
KVFHSEHKLAPPLSVPITGMHFTQEELCAALDRMASGKALPATFAPARLWKLLPDLVVPSLLPCMNLESSALQENWHKVQLFLIPKVAVVREPKNLRPIALLHPASKLLAAMIATRVQPKIAAYLTHVPQWAYLPGRSTADALESVCSHLHQVRSMLQANACNLPQRFHGAVPHKMMGGISISLDVKKAFDSLSHDFLEAAMREADFDECEIALILHLHTHAQLQVGTGAETASVLLGTGVRQGCSLSPILWALATGRVYRLYTAALKEQRLPEGLTNIFADDFFISWTYKSPENFRQALRAIGILVSTLQQVGLELSLDKTVLLMASSGTSAPSVIGGYKKLVEGVPYLRIPVGSARVLLKIVNSHKYLGAHLSYQGFEAQNLKHRMATAWGSFWRLHSILISRSLPLKTKLRLWQACVFSVLRYSLHHVGVPSNGPLLIRQAVHRQLRMIARSPAHLWHVTSSDILARLKVEDPWITLCNQAPAHHATLQPHAQATSFNDWQSKLRNMFSGVLLSTDPDMLIPAAFMELEGVSQDELQEAAAAALTMLQTMALQGRNLFEAPQSQPAGPAQNPASSLHPPALEVQVQTPLRQTFSLTGEQEAEQPAKFTRTNEKGGGGKGPRQGPQTRRQFPSRTPPAGPQPSSAPSGGSPSKITVSASLITQVVQLLLRHADALNSIEQSTTWILFQGTAPPLTVVDAQAIIAEEWNRLKTSNPSAITEPLRVVLWQTWASEFIKRLQTLDTDPNQRNEAIRLQILTEPDCFKYVRWDPSQKRLIPQDTLAPLTAKEILDMLRETIVLCKEDGVLINYHPMRRLTQKMAGAAITFSMHLGLREARAYRFWTIMEALAGNASLQLVATTIRRDRRGRSPLAQALEAELRRLQKPCGKSDS